EWAFAEMAAALVTSNPFEREFLDKLQTTLGLPPEPLRPAIAWHPGCGPWGPTGHPSTAEFGERIEALAESVRRRLGDGAAAGAPDLAMYEKLALYQLYRGHGMQLDLHIDRAVRGDQAAGPAQDSRTIWEHFQAEHRRLLDLPGRALPLRLSPEHVFACFF